MSRYLLALGLLAGCAAPPALVEGDLAAPASPEVSTLVSLQASVVSIAPLAPALQPALPAALRLSGPSVVTTETAPDHGAHLPAASGVVDPARMDHAAMGHDMDVPASGEMDHSQMDLAMDEMPVDVDAPEALADALDAYLAIQRALSRDAFDGVADHALAFVDAWSFATDEAPEADPHFWHMRSTEVDAVELHALALADAADIETAREAFAALSAPFVSLIDAHGAPAGYDLSRFTCGMRSDLPEGGVWLQRGSETQNPYYGIRMLACGTRNAAVPSRAGDMAMDAAPGASGGMPGMDTESTDHSAMDHD